MSTWEGSLASSFDSLRKMPAAATRHLRAVLQSVLGDASRVLEVGAGTGRIGMAIVSPEHDYVGLDRSQEMLSVFRRRVGGAPEARLVQADARLLPFRDRSFDVVLTASVLYLVPQWTAAVEEIRRVLVANGTYVEVFERANLSPAAAEVASAWQELVGAGDEISSRRSATAEAPGEPSQAVRKSARILPVSRWRRQVPVDRYLRDYEARMGPLYPEIPAEQFSSLVRAFAGAIRPRLHGRGTLDYEFVLELAMLSRPALDDVVTWSRHRIVRGADG